MTDKKPSECLRQTSIREGLEKLSFAAGSYQQILEIQDRFIEMVQQKLTTIWEAQRKENKARLLEVQRITSKERILGD